MAVMDTISTSWLMSNRNAKIALNAPLTTTARNGVLFSLSIVVKQLNRRPS